MTINSRNKGATFERDLAKELFLLTGIKFERNLEQVRTVDNSDLTPSDPAWPFAIEAKRYKAGNGCKPEWKAQASRSAAKIGKFPCVVFKFDRLDIRVAVPFAAIAAALDSNPSTPDEWAEITLDGLAYLAREIMAWRA